MHEAVPCGPEQTAVDQQHDCRQPQGPANKGRVTRRRSIKRAVKDPKEPAQSQIDEACEWVCGFRFGTQQQRCQGRTERERVHCGEKGGDRDRHCKLPEKLAGNSCDKRTRNKDRHQHQRDCNNRTSHFIHGFASRVPRRQTMLQMMLDRLHHHNRIIHDNSNRQHQPQQGQVVETETQARHHGKRADDGHRHGGKRNERRTP